MVLESSSLRWISKHSKVETWKGNSFRGVGINWPVVFRLVPCPSMRVTWYGRPPQCWAPPTPNGDAWLPPIPPTTLNSNLDQRRHFAMPLGGDGAKNVDMTHIFYPSVLLSVVLHHGFTYLLRRRRHARTRHAGFLIFIQRTSFQSHYQLLIFTHVVCHKSNTYFIGRCYSRN